MQTVPSLELGNDGGDQFRNLKWSIVQQEVSLVLVNDVQVVKFWNSDISSDSNFFFLTYEIPMIKAGPSTTDVGF